jgi:hypothetical protein
VVADSPVQLIVFDLDGVLVETRDLHYHALNRALAEVPRRAVPCRAVRGPCHNPPSFFAQPAPMPQPRRTARTERRSAVPIPLLAESPCCSRLQQLPPSAAAAHARAAVCGCRREQCDSAIGRNARLGSVRLCL